MKIVFVRRTIRGGSNLEPERHESSSEPVARVVLVRKSPTEYMPQDMGRTARECAGSSGDSSGPSEGKLFGSTREVHRRGRIRGGEGGHVRKGLCLLIYMCFDCYRRVVDGEYGGLFCFII